MRTRTSVAAVLFCLSVAVGCVMLNDREGLQKPDGVCSSIITTGPDGHYLLNRSAMTAVGADRLNACIEAFGIRNVRITLNLSDVMPVLKRN